MKRGCFGSKCDLEWNCGGFRPNCIIIRMSTSTQQRFAASKRQRNTQVDAGGFGFGWVPLHFTLSLLQKDAD